MAFSRDMAKRLYVGSENYADDMYRKISAKSTWNIVLEKYPRLAEFFLTGRGKSELTVLERSLLEYIKQSEFIKPYRESQPYSRQEYEDPPPGQDIATPTPVSPPEPKEPPPDDESPPPWSVLCNADHEGCWCANGSERELIIHGSLPIVGLTEVFGNADIDPISGWNTNTLYTYIYGSYRDKGFITIEVHLLLPNGGQCATNINVYECSPSSCCGDEPECDPDNQETVGTGVVDFTLSVIKGEPPFKTITVSGDGMWLDKAYSVTQFEDVSKRKVTVYADGTQCGSGAVTWVDNCDKQVTCEVRVTNGTWCSMGQGCECGGQDSDGVCNINSVCERIDGTCRQRDRYVNHSFCSGSCNCTGCSVCPDLTYGGICITPTYTRTGTYWSLFDTKMCALEDCATDPLDDPTRRFCDRHHASYPLWHEWRCPPC